MSKTAAAAKSVLLGFLQDASAGLNAQLDVIEARDSASYPRIPDAGWFTVNAAAPLLDENLDNAPYPCVLVYLAGSENRNIQKFRYFSGAHEVVIEIRLSVEGFRELLGLENMLDAYVEAALNVVQSTSQVWGAQGVLYNGRYRVQYRSIELGGLNLIQAAEIRLQMEQHTS